MFQKILNLQQYSKTKTNLFKNMMMYPMLIVQCNTQIK